jgi:hypothetical protein
MKDISAIQAMEKDARTYRAMRSSVVSVGVAMSTVWEAVKVTHPRKWLRTVLYVPAYGSNSKSTLTRCPVVHSSMAHRTWNRDYLKGLPEN